MLTDGKMQTAECRVAVKWRLRVKCRLQTADCRVGIKCRLRVNCRLQTAEWG